MATDAGAPRKVWVVEAAHSGIADDPLVFVNEHDALRCYAELGTSLGLEFDLKLGRFGDDDDEEVRLYESTVRGSLESRYDGDLTFRAMDAAGQYKAATVVGMLVAIAHAAPQLAAHEDSPTDSPKPSASVWYEVRSENEQVERYLAHECGELDCQVPPGPEQWGDLEGARGAAEGAREYDAEATLWIERVTKTEKRERIEAVPPCSP
jgi:hypothetical protein